MAGFISAKVAAEQLLLRRAARRSMVAYIDYMDLGFVPMKHHRFMIEKFEAVERGEIKRLTLALPPGSAKSTYGSKLLPAWYLGRNPTKSILACSHTQNLADSFGRKVRNLFSQPEHARLFGVGISRDSQAAGHWSTDRDGEYLAAGVGVAISGRRADCLAGDTIVSTLDGFARLDELTIRDCVLSYDAKKNALTYSRVVALARRYTECSWRVYTSDGSVVEATGDHSFFTGRGWTPAASLCTGDVLMRSLWNAADEKFGGSLENDSGREGRPVLQSELCYYGEHREGGQPEAPMSMVPRTPSFAESDGVHEAVLFGSVFSCQDEGERRKENNYTRTSLRNLWDFISPEQSNTARAILFAPLQRCRPRIRNFWREQSLLSTWFERSRKPERMVGGEEENLGTRQLSMRGVFIDGQHGSTPHKYDPDGPSARESCSTLLLVPSEIARCGAISAATDTVARVEQVRKRSVVYDIQVEGTQCFFANRILVHNCGIIDDPVANREQADSLSAQERTWDWYLSDFLPRLKPNAAQIIISTRWNDGDLVGRILERERDLWTVIEIPMEAKENDPLGREIGERLWPEWFTDEQIETAKKDTRSWSALYQQTPVIDEGDYFKFAWFGTEYEQIPDNAHYYGASDYAVTEGHGDFTEHGIFALDAFGNIYVVDWWRGQTTADVWIEHQIDLINEYEPLLWFGEAGPIRRATEPYLTLRMSERDAFCRMEWLPSIGDKATRLRAFQARAERGKVFFPKNAAWKADLLQQLTRFPAARYDDGVDVCSLIGRGLDLIKAPRKSGWNKVAPIQSDPNAGAQAWMTH